MPPNIRVTDDGPKVCVNRLVSPVYPNWVMKGAHPELESTGPVEYTLADVLLWLHDGQTNGWVVTGLPIYQYLKDTDILKSCLSLRDGEEIKKLGVVIFRKFFDYKAVFLWKSVVWHRGGRLAVPCLYVEGDEVEVGWDWLNSNWCSNEPAAVHRTVNPVS